MKGIAGPWTNSEWQWLWSEKVFKRPSYWSWNLDNNRSHFTSLH